MISLPTPCLQAELQHRLDCHCSRPQNRNYKNVGPCKLRKTNQIVTLILGAEGSADVGVVVIEKVARWLGICACQREIERERE